MLGPDSQRQKSWSGREAEGWGKELIKLSMDASVRWRLSRAPMGSRTHKGRAAAGSG